MSPATPDPDRDPAAAPRSTSWRLERATIGRLDFIDAAGTRHTDVDVVRAFPVSLPAGPVAIVARDGDELAWIDSLADVGPETQGLLEHELAQREFLPLILRIVTVSDGEPMEWSVVTDRGPRRFAVTHGDDIARTGDGGAFITDSCGVRYRIASIPRLDARSRRLLDRMD
jgi:hypothetical protein